MPAPRRRWAPELKTAAVRLLEAGRAPHEVAAQVGAPVKLVNEWRASWRQRAADAAERLRQEQLDRECRQRTLALIAAYDRQRALRVARLQAKR